MSRVIWYVLAAVLLLIVAAALLLPVLVGEKQLLSLASAVLEEQTGATLTVNGTARLSLFPALGVDLQQVEVAMPGEEQPGLQARSLVVGVKLLPLFSRRLEIDSLALDGVLVRTVAAERETIDTGSMSDAELDAFYAARRRALEQAGGARPEEALALPLALEVERLTVTDSRLELSDAGGEVKVVELERLQALGLNLEARPIPVELALRLPGEPAAELALAGTIAIDQAAGTVTLDPLELAVAGLTGERIQLKARGAVDIFRQVADLQVALAQGEARGEGTVRYASFESPQIDATLKLNLFDPALLALAGPEAAADSSTEGERSGGASGDEPLPLAALRAIDTRADLTIERAVFAPHTVQDLHLKLRAVEGVVTVGSLSGMLYGGRLEARARLDGSHSTARLNTSGSLREMDIPALLAVLESEPVLSGKANLEWQLSGRGRTRNELVANLEGPVNAVVDRGVLEGIGVEKMLCEAVALVNRERLTAELPGTSSFRALHMTVTLGGGKARLDPVRAELPQITLTGRGEMDLLGRDFKSKFEARLSPALAELDPACRVKERLTAIDWPVRCKGQIGGDPGEWCRVDTDEIVEDLARYEGRRKLEKEAGKLLDKLLK
jgi:AsmA protein